MTAAANKVVVLDYKLTNDEGEVLDQSEGRGPLSYLHGHGNIIPGLEREVEGKNVGESFQVTVLPTDGYGEYDANMISEVPKTEFGDRVDEITEGMQLQIQTEEGLMLVQVEEIKDDAITLNGNHPLAGINLHFDITIVEVREATAEEIEHGHVHGEGGHHH
ncbi:MAG: peptidylprolyl isomerase [bacterium]|nr:peptidylprolyl isomerase [bacterium]